MQMWSKMHTLLLHIVAQQKTPILTLMRISLSSIPLTQPFIFVTAW